jgi:hypothetical protein
MGNFKKLVMYTCRAPFSAKNLPALEHESPENTFQPVTLNITVVLCRNLAS